jgi:hypothetical protein
MLKKMKIAVLLVMLVSVLAACSGAQKAASQTGSTANNRNGFGGDPATMPVESKLAIGFLKLEGTDKAVTADEAKTQLPLWKALKALSAGNNTAQDEITALYQQIEDGLTADQVKAIKDLTWKQEDLTALGQQYGIQMGGAGGAGGAASNLTTEQRATRVAQFQAQGGAGGNGGGFAGGPPGDFGGGGFTGGAGSTGTRSSTRTAQSTPSAAQTNRRALGLNSMFLDAVIKLLEQRAG